MTESPARLAMHEIALRDNALLDRANQIIAECRKYIRLSEEAEANRLMLDEANADNIQFDLVRYGEVLIPR